MIPSHAAPLGPARDAARAALCAAEAALDACEAAALIDGAVGGAPAQSTVAIGNAHHARSAAYGAARVAADAGRARRMADNAAAAMSDRKGVEGW